MKTHDHNTESEVDKAVAVVCLILAAIALAVFVLCSGCSTARVAYNPTDAQLDAEAQRVQEIRGGER